MPDASAQQLRRVELKGFRSYRTLDLRLRKTNVLIGANGSGKSNFIDILRLLSEMTRGDLQLGVKRRGGADKILHLGPKITPRMDMKFWFGDNAYILTMEPTVDNSLVFAAESGRYQSPMGRVVEPSFGRGNTESKIADFCAGPGAAVGIADWIYTSLVSWRVYHFHDTSAFAKMRRAETVRDDGQLRHDASNLAPFLLHLQGQHPAHYLRILEIVRLAAPFVDKFLLRPAETPDGDTVVSLEWLQPGSDYPFHPSQLSDGTLRFICLATALLQPNPPKLLALDEPELGLHPYALSLLADLIKSFSEQTIISTQSSTLLSHFEPNDVVVAARQAGQTTLARLSDEAYKDWLSEYTLGELWEKSVVGGGPQRENV